MKLRRRRFLRLAAGAVALPAVSRLARAEAPTFIWSEKIAAAALREASREAAHRA